MKKIFGDSLGQAVSMFCLGLFALICILPVILVIIVSFSSQSSIAANGYSFFPSEWSVEAYEYVGRLGGQLKQSYLVTIYETVCGTLLTLLLTSLMGYVLSRKDFMLRKYITGYILVTMLFGGGLMSSYIINTSVYNLRNNLLVLIVPGAVSAYTCFVMRTFISANVPDSLVEAAKIDGASEYYLFFRIIIPIIVPVIAAMGFMTAVGHWNEWQTAYLYIDKPEYSTLQLMLVRIETSLNFFRENLLNLSAEEMDQLRRAPTDSARMAILIISLGPVMIMYPFFQRFFIKGITIGAVKG